MDDTQALVREAVAVGMKAIEQGVAQLKPSRTALTRQVRPREHFERALANSALFVFTGLLALLALGYTQPAAALLALFVLIYLGSAALFILNIKSALDSLYTIVFSSERHAPLLILAQHLASFAVLAMLAIALLGIYFLFPKTESFAAAAFSALLSLL